ncbi:N-acetyl-gamma-glutamyl-phosphate reductase [Govanella unica]|uniref:N-acetyl-gamma-glutamyl-phosphate reductase n=1 Tax=Govanella unica TaxID=2975056 RepID=A0A9X3TYK4_9PROT|nr:N-acetyl-gamma-glutamyl-phosphate reductase [Govania unica]MDA5194114.1 N-acetyl-gamma-glutamyl-phosphate reductase [Govania unica]
MTDRKIRVGILGASGYTGADLIRLACRHPNIEIVFATADRKAGKALADVFPHLGRLKVPNLIAIEDIEWGGIEVEAVFCALPHATSQKVVKGILHGADHSLVDELIVEDADDIASSIKGKIKVIDLSADFRLRDLETYAEWYGKEHDAPELQKIAVYGLTEIYRDEIKKADLVACPGCYPTAALLSLIPLLDAKVITGEDIIIDAKSGVSGAGRSAKEQNLFTEVAEGMHAYAIASHRHAPEIEQELSRALGQSLLVNFTPHLVPMNRGEYETIYVKLSDGVTADDLRAVLTERYADEPFVHVVEKGMVPASRYVRGSNDCMIGVFEDRIPGRAMIIATIDNLVKGSSGQAIQNFNLMFGLPETTGLEQAPMFP